MRFNTTSTIALGFLMTATLVACGSSSSGSGSTTQGSSSTTGGDGGSGGQGTGGQGGGGSTSSSSSASSSVASSSSQSSSSATGSSTTSTGTGGAPSCNDQCTTMYPTAYQKFVGYELTECGCATGSPCATDCAGSCASGKPNGTSPNSACATCLSAEGNKGLGSSCTLTAAETDCAGDSTCKSFSSCGLCCATGSGPC